MGMYPEGSSHAPSAGGQPGLPERARRFSDLFIAMVGHDLRNPLSAIINTAELVRMLGGPDAERTAERLQRASSRMSRMIDQIIDVTRIELGEGLDVQPADGDLATLAAASIADLEAARPGSAIELDATGDGRAWFDPDRTAQLLAVLLGNALDHGQAGSPVLVTVECGDPAAVRVVVANRGALAPGTAGPALDPLGQGRKKGPRPSGLGMGLFVARHVAEAQGGGLALECEGETTRAILTVPRAAPG